MTPNDVLWLMCGAAIVVMGLVALFFGASAGTRSLDDVYERRARRRADRGAAAAGDGTAGDRAHDDDPQDPAAPATPAGRPAVSGEAVPDRRMAGAAA